MARLSAAKKSELSRSAASGNLHPLARIKMELTQVSTGKSKRPRVPLKGRYVGEPLWGADAHKLTDDSLPILHVAYGDGSTALL